MKYSFAAIASLLLLTTYHLPLTTFARTTPEDIVNAKRGEYRQIVSRYSPTHQQQLSTLSDNITAVNKKITDDLETNAERQGQILDEYARRHPSADVENARYWLTFAHEAIAYQAAHIYIFNLTGESNIRRDAQSLISNLQSDLSILKSKVEKSRQIIAQLAKGK